MGLEFRAMCTGPGEWRGALQVRLDLHGSVLQVSSVGHAQVEMHSAGVQVQQFRTAVAVVEKSSKLRLIERIHHIDLGFRGTAMSRRSMSGLQDSRIVFMRVA
jgi:hypothetical protein